jgi:phosphoribosylformylglycinamidine synthase
MDINKAKACILRVGGTNCDLELKIALEELGIKTEILHMKQILKRNLDDYHLLLFPGGFSYGDYVRAGAIWGKEILVRLGNEIKKFIEQEKIIMGICNGFQVLIEAGFLPDFSDIPKAVLATNISAKYECRWIYLRVERNDIPFTKNLKLGEILRIPIGHGEGRFLTSDENLKELIRNNCIVFRYAKPSGEIANREYPYNPNGSIYDIAGICNKKGNIIGLMPHPERAFFGWQLPEIKEGYGDGKKIFDGIIDYLSNY